MRRRWVGAIIAGLVAPLLVAATVALPARPAAAAGPTYGRFCSSGAPIRSVATGQKVVAFTFDDGPWPVNTAATMTAFERYGWRASFFMIGVNVRSYPDITRSVVERGHGIAAHSMTHSYGVSTIAREVAATGAIIQSTTGVRTTFFRSPGLTLSSTIDRAIYDAGMCNISTASDLGDWRSPRVSASTLCARYKNALRPGAIILLHDGGSHRPTIDALPCMLEYTRQQGYAAVDLGALLAGSFAGPAPTPPPPPPPPAPGTSCPRSSYGSRGTAVVLAQRAVMNDGIYLRGGADGIFGVYTRAAVATYQSRRGLAATGAVDDGTAAAMGLCRLGPAPPPAPATWTPVGFPQRGGAVASIQRAVINSGIYLLGGADGYFGRYTEEAVRRYQSARGLPATGVVDQATAVAMGLFAPPAAIAATVAAPAEATAAVATAAPETTTTTTVAPPTTSTTTTTTTTTTVAPSLPATVSVGDRVFLDGDGDGLWSATTETGVAGVVVRLLDASGAVLATTTTDDAGVYTFGGITPGTYVVEFVQPADVTFSVGDSGTDDAIDSDTADIVVRTEPAETVARATVTVDGTADVLTVDAGLVLAAPDTAARVAESTADRADPPSGTDPDATASTSATSSPSAAATDPPSTLTEPSSPATTGGDGSG